MDIAGEYMLFIGQNAAAVIGKNKLDLGVLLFAECLIIRNVIDAGKGMGVASEQSTLMISIIECIAQAENESRSENIK